MENHNDPRWTTCQGCGQQERIRKGLTTCECYRHDYCYIWVCRLCEQENHFDEGEMNEWRRIFEMEEEEEKKTQNKSDSDSDSDEIQMDEHYRTLENILKS